MWLYAPTILKYILQSGQMLSIFHEQGKYKANKVAIPALVTRLLDIKLNGKVT